MKLHTTNYRRQIEAAIQYLSTKESNKNASIIKGLFVIAMLSIVMIIFLFLTIPMPK
jgi:hypothetical protein